jgi:hypothetical protein
MPAPGAVGQGPGEVQYYAQATRGLRYQAKRHPTALWNQIRKLFSGSST